MIIAPALGAYMTGGSAPSYTVYGTQPSYEGITSPASLGFLSNKTEVDIQYFRIVEQMFSSNSDVGEVKSGPLQRIRCFCMAFNYAVATES